MVNRILIGLLCAVLLAGCGTQNGKPDKKNESVSKTDEDKYIATEKISATPESVKVDERNQILQIGVDKRKLVLRDLTTGEIVHTYKLKKNQTSYIYTKISHGYCAEIITANRELKDQTNGGIIIYDTPGNDEIENSSIVFFDEDLKEKNRIDIGSIAKKIDHQEILTSECAVSRDGSKVVWDLGDRILCYDVKKEQDSYYEQINKDDIVMDYFDFVGNDKIAFFGSQGEMEHDTCYGYLDLSDGKVYSFVENEYEAFSLWTNEKYMWINDGADPKTGKSSGKFVVVDTEHCKKIITKVDGTESTRSRLTEDGKYVVSVMETSEKDFRVRQYDAGTGEIKEEKEYKFKEGVHTSEIIYIGSGVYGIVYGMSEGVRLEEFSLK